MEDSVLRPCDAVNLIPPLQLQFYMDWSIIDYGAPIEVNQLTKRQIRSQPDLARCLVSSTAPGHCPAGRTTMLKLYPMIKFMDRSAHGKPARDLDVFPQ